MEQIQYARWTQSQTTHINDLTAGEGAVLQVRGAMRRITKASRTKSEIEMVHTSSTNNTRRALWRQTTWGLPRVSLSHSWLLNGHVPIPKRDCRVCLPMTNAGEPPNALTATCSAPHLARAAVIMRRANSLFPLPAPQNKATLAPDSASATARY